MPIQGLLGPITRQLGFYQINGMVQKAAWSSGIDDEADLKFEAVPVAVPFQGEAIGGITNLLQIDPFQILDAKSLRDSYKQMIEIRAIPVCICDLVTRVGGNQ